MAQIRTIDTADNFQDQAMILGFREARQYSLNIDDWSEIKFGILYSLVETDSLRPTSSLFNEPGATPKDYFWFGLKETNQDFPTDTNYIGYRLDGDADAISNGLYRFDNDYQAVISSSAKYVDKTPAYYIGGCYDPDVTGSRSGPASFLAARILVQNKGLPNQTVRIYNSTDGGTSYVGVDSTSKKYTTTLLQNKLLSAGFTTNSLYWGEYSWVSGSSALSLPKSLFMYCPLSSRRLCIHGVAIQIEN